MAGLYVHIPFCRQACAYCNFHFTTSLREVDALIEAMIREMELQSPIWQAFQFDTLYFGGGTPSLLSPAQLEKLFYSIFQYFRWNKPLEITLEANPEDITPENLSCWKQLGIDRLSIGIQSLEDELLQALHRNHTAYEAMRSVYQALNAGFEKLSVDLIYGIPELRDEQWVHAVNHFLNLSIPHLSCYALTIEPKTLLEKKIRQHRYPPIDEQQAARQYLILLDIIEQAGYEAYEISNFARPGYRAIHNSHYWQGIPYLGIGPSAHSYLPPVRRWNPAHNKRYIQAIQQGILPFEEEPLNTCMQYNEYVMLRLRTAEGVDIREIEQRFGWGYVQYFQQIMKPYVDQGWVIQCFTHYRLSRQGKLFADRIAADAFADEASLYRNN
ncbi:MAG: radical SAM family heme chaperone HemW [Thermoflavifilum sp.]|nr:radical SAM family heme chaperone HemW [Thermoflavifilum sp.]